MNVRLFTLALLLWTALPACAGESGPVYVIPIEGEVNTQQFLFLRRGLKEAERVKASAIVLDMETYGGELKAAVSEMDALLKTKVPTYTYIDSKAISAGALIALATGKIYMAPTAVIGAAAPVLSDGSNITGTMGEKTVSATSAIARAAAAKAGHNPDLADSFIRKEAELKIGDTMIDRADSLLTLNATEAMRPSAGKPLLAEGIATSLQEMLKLAQLSGPVRHFKPTGFEQLASVLTMLSPLLLLGGILGAYIEFKIPGFGLPGIISAVCFILFFGGSYLAGLAGWETAVVFALGLALILSEVFLHPGTVLPGILGVFLVLGALLWAMVDRYPGEGLLPSSGMLLRPLVNLLSALVVSGLIITWLARYLPRTRLYGRFVLSESVTAGVSAAPRNFALGTVAPGMEGIATTTLRPSGKATIQGAVLDVVSRGEFIEEGTALRVAAVEGPRVVVEAV